MHCPKLSAITRLPYWIAHIRGYEVQWMTSQHKKYGHTIRFGPNDISFADAQAWRDIYTVSKGKKENNKVLGFYGRPADSGYMVVEPDAIRHAIIRKSFLPAFSEQSLRKQEPLFQKYADLMVASARKNGSLDMMKLFDFTTFDIMAEFTFGEPLGMLETNQYSQWVATAFRSLKAIPVMQFISSYTVPRTIFRFAEPNYVKKIRFDFYDHTVSRVDKRLQQGSDQPDLWNCVEESTVLTAPGTETTSTLLTGLTYYLIRNPDKMKILTDEVRGTFSSNENITFEALARLEYLNACIREGLRVYPPAPSGLPRVIAEGGSIVMGKWLPAGTCVSVHPTAANSSPANFRNPDEFIPERWLGGPGYEADVREVAQPFSAGPRNCLGMNMAWHEMRLLLAKLVFNFDILSDVGPEWRDQRVYLLRERKPLICQLKDVRKAA
ncbi:hypothetical protein ONZ43_g2571 [Nemania bipapillata]|uniref:Uncharacterized protein n=1 Tax=Nemania bipapillata TaxID=110536 RepID=A0ACC2J008_9PEZI|nr:hypothetical protein ONZ43_g2571 [Nemania bipapillata]